MSKFKSPWQMIGLVSLIGADMAICVVSGVLLGQYIDNWIGTTPWLMLVGLLIGMGLGVYTVYRIVRAYL
ncbi:AtpZ/AtpI family protein [Brevibacillus dissolubilis]|uniref:AtpZ/AtpI family protein n=1 Tax=Brevibacillus dissolubilis TaxID=1844116 RepID=UPI0021002E40|nr:AtpZ/AtpI family protein [Brevibacillus dissolubilis]